MATMFLIIFNINNLQTFRYTDASLEGVPCSYWSFENTTTSDLLTQQCTSWDYQGGHSTVQSTFSLTCDDEWLLKLPGYAIMLGIFFGSFICGMASDQLVFNL